MTTENESKLPAVEKYQYNNFRRPRTYPKRWDMSTFDSNEPAMSPDKASMQANETDEAFDLSPDMGLPDVSFSERQLGPHLDALDKPEGDHFSAY